MRLRVRVYELMCLSVVIGALDLNTFNLLKKQSSCFYRPRREVELSVSCVFSGRIAGSRCNSPDSRTEGISILVWCVVFCESLPKTRPSLIAYRNFGKDFLPVKVVIRVLVLQAQGSFVAYCN